MANSFRILNLNLTVRLASQGVAELIRMNRFSLSNYSRHVELADQGIDYQPEISRIDITPRKPPGLGKAGRFGGDLWRGMFN